MRSRLLALAILAASLVLAGCDGAGGGGVIKPEPTKNPMQDRTEKSAK